MAQKNSKKGGEVARRASSLPDETKNAVLAVLLGVAGLFLVLAAFNFAGVAGADVYRLGNYLLGFGYFLLPLLFFVLAGTMLREKTELDWVKLSSSLVFILSGLGFIDIANQKGGLVGALIGRPAVHFFDVYASVILLGGLLIISLIVLLEGKISLELLQSIAHSFQALTKKLLGLSHSPTTAETELSTGDLPIANHTLPENFKELEQRQTSEAESVSQARAASVEVAARDTQAKNAAATLKALLGQYTPPPLSLLERDKGRPGVGDIKANANLIKRTLANFGIVVELDEISIGPSVTRYAIKPAEGVRLQKIVSLQTNLELALAAHPVRIEAPIPGKSLVGIEVPNSAKVTVGLGTLLEAPEFRDSPKPLLVGLGRDITGGSHFGNIAKMPHMLIAGATGSGKSVTIHTIIASLLYRSGPQQLRFLMIDPKRVELTLYNRIPHLLSPVITDPKRAIMALRWAGKEMERRYNVLEEHRVRDLESYHQNVLTPALEKLRKSGATDAESLADQGAVPEAMPYIVIIIDELADIMQTYPRELEAAVVRLAQMSRAVGIHLILSTQRPSVNVITGLIKANIPSRLALQVASQIDSRTILDQSGAEKLLGAGDMLYLAGDMGKPVRLQSAFIGESEVKKMTDFIANNNDAELPIDIGAPLPGSGTSISVGGDGAGSAGGLEDEEVDDDMYEAAHAAVLEAGKASTSYIQRKLRVGYARAARLIDMLEERGVIGPGDGAKPREILGQHTQTPPTPEAASTEEV